MEYNQKMMSDEKKTDLEQGKQFIKSLGFSDTRDAQPKNEPKGSIMDQIFGSKVHKCHELNDRVVKSGAYEKTNSMLAVHKDKNQKFEQSYVQGGPLFERFRTTSEMAKHKKEANIKNEFAMFYKDQMRTRQEFMALESQANNQFQKHLEQDTRNYENETRKSMMEKRRKTTDTMNYVKQQVPQ